MNTSIYRKAIASLLCAAICTGSAAGFSGCSGDAEPTSTADEAQTTEIVISTSDEAEAVDALAQLGIDAAALGIEPNILHDKNPVGFQLDMPKKGDTVAVIHTNQGDITLRLFPEQAPKTVTNFLNLAREGKYDGTTFFRVIDDFIIQGGHCGNDPESPNGVSSYGAQFDDEFCDKLFNIRGAVSMASTDKDSNGSQFFINQTDAEAFAANGGWDEYARLWAGVKTQLVNYRDSSLLSAFIQENGDKCFNTDIVPDGVKKLYEKNGGNAYLDGTYNAVDRGNTVFAQVIEGMEVVDKIAAAQVDKDNKPLESIVIDSVELSEYNKAG